ncbi:MAG: tetratricopeptide repeat protein [Deltaproteobacteria bacterium]|nr:MAG: tetratricopeptide repeat protein [Deltaproteobacteria bacterium]
MVLEQRNPLPLRGGRVGEGVAKLARHTRRIHCPPPNPLPLKAGGFLCGCDPFIAPIFGRSDLKRLNSITRLASLIILICPLFLASLAAGADLLSQGLEAQKKGKNDQAVELLKKYLKDHPNAAEARKGLALALNALDRKAEALEEVNRGLAAHPKDTALLLAQGSILAGLERREEAIAAFSKVLAADPKNVEALKDRGENLAQEGRFEEAQKDYDRAAALAPKDPWVFFKRGMGYFCQGKYTEAVADFSTAIKLNPGSPLFYFCRGQIYLLHLHQKDKAVDDFQKGCGLGHPLCCRELDKLDIAPIKK